MNRTRRQKIYHLHSPSSLLSAICCSVRISLCLPQGRLVRTNPKTCSLWTAASTSGRLEWALRTRRRTFPSRTRTARSCLSCCSPASARPCT
uniref:Uncharacterized protein n=1 Tax=Ixodes ricinus TaxID=34613 RepID=A0A147BTU5_IXORI